MSGETKQEILKRVRLAETIAKFLGGKSAELDHPDNQNADFLAGYAVGMTTDKSNEAHDCIAEEWRERGECSANDPSFREWKRGYWTATFHRLEGREWQKQNEHTR